MFNKVELVSFTVAVVCMVLALYLVRVETTMLAIGQAGSAANVQASAVAGAPVVVANGESVTQARAEAYLEATNARGEVTELVIDDVRPGSGDAVAEGDTVRVHYVGRLTNGQEFDNSRQRGIPFTFTVGEGRVIPGWEQGIVGMQVGGQRILVIPADLAYGSQSVGPIPPNSTLIFAIELLGIE